MIPIDASAFYGFFLRWFGDGLVDVLQLRIDFPVQGSANFQGRNRSDDSRTRCYDYGDVVKYVLRYRPCCWFHILICRTVFIIRRSCAFWLGPSVGFFVNRFVFFAIAEYSTTQLRYVNFKNSGRNSFEFDRLLSTVLKHRTIFVQIRLIFPTAFEITLLTL